MANTTKHIEGGGSQKKRYKARGKNRSTSGKKEASGMKKVMSPAYLDLSPNTPGKYGVDY